MTVLNCNNIFRILLFLTEYYCFYFDQINAIFFKKQILLYNITKCNYIREYIINILMKIIKTNIFVH